VERGFAAWLRLGSAEAAEAETGIKAETLRSWKFREPQRFATAQRAHDEALAEYRVALSRKAWEAMGDGLATLQAILRTAEKDADRVAAARALVSLAVETDKVTRLDAGEPTEIAETRTRPVEVVDGELDAMLKEAGF